MRVELFVSPVCDRCVQAKNAVQSVVNDIEDDRLSLRVVEVLDEIDYAVAIGVLSTPAIAINGQLVLACLPRTKILRRVLEDQLAQDYASGH